MPSLGTFLRCTLAEQLGPVIEALNTLPNDLADSIIHIYLILICNGLYVGLAFIFQGTLHPLDMLNIILIWGVLTAVCHKIRFMSLAFKAVLLAYQSLAAETKKTEQYTAAMEGAVLVPRTIVRVPWLWKDCPICLERIDKRRTHVIAAAPACQGHDDKCKFCALRGGCHLECWERSRNAGNNVECMFCRVPVRLVYCR